MKLSIDQALQRGIEAHKADRIQEADQYYTAILKAQPKHPDANHNMGILAVRIGKVEAALPFFEMALEAKPSITQFWLSYIDTLIRLERLNDAKAAFEQAKISGAKGSELDKIEKRLVGDQAAANIESNFQDPPNNQLQVLINLYTQGQFEQTLEETSQLVIEFPKSVTLHNLIGAANRALGRLEEAIEAYTRALVIKPDYADAHRNMGNALQDQGKLEEAIEAYNKALLINPDDAKSYNNMGNALKNQGKPDEAIEAYNKALSINPDYVDAYNNMGSALQQEGKLEEAIEAYNKALIINPDYADTYRNMGDVLHEKGRSEEAIASYEKAISLKPDYADAYNNMGNALKNQGKLEEALVAYNKALSINPDDAKVYYSLAVILIAQGNLNEAISFCEKALLLQPNDAQVRHILSSLTRKTTNSAPREYVENLFNLYADQFDRELVEKLEYTIPKKIVKLAVKESPSGFLGSILDLGCGTGLTGIEIKQFCSNLEGIDLSIKMLEKAKKTNVYNKLSHIDIIDFLSNEELDFDYFISADVFIYVGELSEIFRLIKSRNKKPGKLIFSTEHNEKNGFLLETSGRYSHSKNYIEVLCKKFGYSLSHFSKTNLRKEKGEFLAGALYLLDF